MFADPELILYVKAEAVVLPRLPGHADLARFELNVRDVLEDRAEGEEAGTRLASGITIEGSGDPGVVARRRARVGEILAD